MSRRPLRSDRFMDRPMLLDALGRCREASPARWCYLGNGLPSAPYCGTRSRAFRIARSTNEGESV